jgi:cytochrome c553
MNKLTLSLLVAAGIALAAGPVLAAGNPAAGEAKSEACVDCHGDDGKGDDETPSIAGLSVEEFTQAMKEYQDGTRKKSSGMIKAAKKASAEDVADLAAYYATLKP